MEILKTIRNIVWFVVLLEFIMIIHLLTNKLTNLENKTDKIQMQINQIEKGN